MLAEKRGAGNMMDDQLFKFLQEELRFIKDQLRINQDKTEKHLKEIEAKFETHQTKDLDYWRKIDVQEGQVSLLTFMLGGGFITAIASWVWYWIKTKVGS